ncbi:MAG TPA: precorrin-6y C5,15-methyltransferase (decarboxylating) subunit CbiE [Mycobacteriales bacterium]|nr:precorrin-6y C5,15-methyltransferase (decarboxylating) subunit CbiE [Mycobacteriales bacterium]
MTATITVVGIGEDGWEGLSADARAALTDATSIVGSQRQLDLLPPLDATLELLPSPLLDGLDALVATTSPLCVLASGDPMFHGIGTTLARRVPAERLRVIPAMSSVTLACARLAWPATDVTVLSTLSVPLSVVGRALQPGRRILLLCRDGSTPAQLAALLTVHGWPDSPMHVLERLGGPKERVVGPIPARDLAGSYDDLCVVAVVATPDAGSESLSTLPGLPESAYETDGQITRRELRVLAISALMPMPGQLLWDIGAGSGSIGVEWMRCDSSLRAIAIESRADRAERIARNAEALGVPTLRVVAGEAPAVLADLPTPDAVFVGGGLTTPRLLETAWDRLAPGGRLVAHAVTVESEAVLHQARADHGGDLVKIDASHAEPLGSFTTWRPALPIVQWQAVKR